MKLAVNNLVFDIITCTIELEDGTLSEALRMDSEVEEMFDNMLNQLCDPIFQHMLISL
ncbi:hypothetical protein NEIELOOT_01883 [Neisseria elongata subsp. glycolytica ATCC 29315]|uniref:Uncharacterized protein n=1 Tax=Neisseria elongata subsp. glycolytica ATCC 29315 TaxID=546263 RepID=D4DS40_NEIEG|nr:hypothetical protein NEIELOOT_01883 [Neisseria elongata subsp. glycolytica ATCC 29315]